MWDEKSFAAARLTQPQHLAFWEHVILVDHPRQDFLLENMRGMKPSRFFRRFKGSFMGKDPNRTRFYLVYPKVLACILSNPRPSCDVDLSLWHAVLQSERKNTYDTPSAIASIKQQQFLIQVQDNVCIICSTPVKKADRWVKCIECQELMHSDCAGYDSSDNTPFDCICSYLRCPCCSAKKYSENPIRSRATLM